MNLFVITKRELLQFSSAPLTYFIGAVFLFLTGVTFFFSVALSHIFTLYYVFYVASLALLFVSPLLTCRLLSIETRSGTFELLFVTPIRIWEVVIGKFLAVVIVFVTMLTPTFSYLILLFLYGKSNIFVSFSCYVGLILLGAMLMSIGLLSSAISANPVIAAILALFFTFVFWLIGELGAMMSGFLGQFMAYLSMQKHLQYFQMGILNASNIIYFTSATLIMLVIATQLLESNREQVW